MMLLLLSFGLKKWAFAQKKGDPLMWQASVGNCSLTFRDPIENGIHETRAISSRARLYGI